MNKNLFKSLAFAAVAVIAGACAKEQITSGDGETVEMTFNVDVPETTITTKGLSDAAQVDELKFQLFIKEGTGYKMVQEQTVPVTDKKAVVKASLVKRQSYEAAFWAQTSGTGFYETTDLRAVKMNIANVKANEPTMDAFWRNDSFIAAPGMKPRSVTLLRALAQVNFGAVVPTGADALSITKSQVVMKGVPTTLNVLLGSKDKSHSGSEDITFQDNAPISGEKLMVGETAYDYIATAYVFAPKADKMLTDISSTVTFSNGKTTTISTPNVPIQRNYRTNILGNLLNVDAEWNVNIDDRFQEPNITYDPVSVGLMKGTTVTLTEDYKVLKDNWSGVNIPIGTESVLNLNGHRFANEENGKTADAKSALVVKGKLTINGDGEVFCEGNTEKKPNVTVQPSNTGISVLEGGYLIINGGSYSVGTDFSGKCNSTIYVENVGKVGKVEIYGGTFTNAEGTDGHSFVLNQDDQLTEKCITVYGGTFIGFNPADNNADGEHTNYVAEGYRAIEITYEGKQAWKVEKIPAVTTQEGLNDEITNGTAGSRVTINLAKDATFTLNNGIANEAEKSRNVIFLGDGTQTMDVITGAINAEGGQLNYQRGSSFTFKNITVKAGEGSFDGIVCDELVFENCTITGKLTFYGKASFKDCVFENTMANQYSIWTWGGTDVTFDKCTFNTNGKAILLYGQATAAKPTNLVVKNCIFNDRNNGSAGKAAIEIGNDYNATYSLTITKCEVNGFADGKNTRSKYWANKNSMDAEHLSVTIDSTKIQ